MRTAKCRIVYVLGFCVAALCLTYSAIAQSSDQNFPTPITAADLSGTIKARDIGDPRVTTYFFAFDGEQGDIFINVVTKNLSGDIDIFSAEGLRPLAKMVVYADADVSETGRLIYLRKPERLLLRIEGRPPGDDAATFRIKFGGSFVALKATTPSEELKPVAKKDETGIRVNSVGTIIEIKPKPAAVKNPETKKPEATAAVTNEDAKPKKNAEAPAKKPIIVIEDLPKPDGKIEAAKNNRKPDPKPVVTRPSKPRDIATVAKSASSNETAKTEEKKPDPLANIRLVIQLKDGGLIEHTLNEVVKFSVDNGVLTVIGKDGKIARYAMLLVTKVTIE